MFLSVLHCHMVLLIYKFLNISVEISLYICIFWNVVILVAPIQNTSVSSSSLPEGVFAIRCVYEYKLLGF